MRVHRRSDQILSFTAFWVLSTGIVSAQPPILRYASDVPGSQAWPASSYPDSFTRSGSKVYFVACSQASGTELWVYDTAPHVVKDIHPGSESGLSSTSPVGSLLDGRVVFAAREIRSPNSVIWVTDGTEPGTHALQSNTGLSARVFNPAQSGFFAALSPGRVVFFAAGPTAVAALWSTDGTNAGTNVATLNSGSSTGVFRHSAGGIAYFSASSSSLLWRTDGTPEGTFQLGQWSSVKFLTVDAATYFICSDTTPTTRGLWTTDGTVEGTHRLVDAGVTTLDLAAVGPNLIYNGTAAASGAEPWAYNTLTSTATLLADIYPFGDSSPRDFTPLGSGVIFDALTPSTPISTRQLWITNGTPESTHLLFNPGILETIDIGTIRSGISNAYFLSSNGQRLWVTDGTAVGTSSLATAPRSVLPSLKGDFIPDGSSRFLFRLNTSQSGDELWISDGTPNGTQSLDINPGFTSSVVSPVVPPVTNRHSAVAANGRVYFPAILSGTSSPQSSLVTASAAPADARILRSFASGPTEINSFQGRLYFPAGDSTSNVELWSSDGTPAGTSLAAEISARSSSQPRSLTPVGNRLFMVADAVGSPLGFPQPWYTLFMATPGLPGVAQVVSNSPTLPRIRLTTTNGSAPESLTPALGKLFFVGMADPLNSSMNSLIVSDGTDQGTIALAPNPSLPFFEWHNRLYFVAQVSLTNAGSVFLYSTDGTIAGTRVESRVSLGTFPLAVTDTHLFLLSPDANGVSQLVAFDRAAGTLPQLTSFAGTQGFVGLTPSPAAAIGNRVVFSAANAIAGTELWSSDGTLSGTLQIADLFPGPSSSNPLELTSTRSGVFFIAANSDGVGVRLYVTDGTSSGTRPVPIAPGSPTLSPFAFYPTFEYFVPSPSRLFVLAANSTAEQVWYLDTCFADFDASGRVDANDLFAFLAAWFALDPHADTNADAQLTVDDIFSYIQLWFTGCP